MSIKKYKVRIENGKVTPLEPLDSFTKRDAILIFLDDYINEDNAILSLISSDPANKDIFSNKEDIYTLNDGKPLND